MRKGAKPVRKGKVIEAWVGANSEESARHIIGLKYPDVAEGKAQIVNLRQTISGMWSYRIEWAAEEAAEEEPAADAETETESE